ncbi:DUF4301 family protein [Balneolales bacterium ANBcel1]|nr:DUF4301 family protein [Balneolales bacterium ANBcel1]
MDSKHVFTDQLKQQIIERGMTTNQVEGQLDRFRQGFPDLQLVRSAAIDNGITQFPDKEHRTYIDRFEQAQSEGRVMKFIPASGAASRMFKTLQSMLNAPEKLTPDYFDSHPDDEGVSFTRTFLGQLENFAFFEDLQQALQNKGLDAVTLREQGDYHTLISHVLEEKGLGLASLPKALIPFHRYSDHSRTPMEEHIVEAKEYTKKANGNVRIHFTISPEHESLFHERLEMVRGRYEADGTNLLVETSFQKPETDTIAARPDFKPFLDDSGKAVFRPGGHGALLANLEQLKADIVFIKNIDNIVPDRLRETTYRYKKVIGGCLIILQDEIFSFLNELESGSVEPSHRKNMLHFVREVLCIEPPEGITAESPDTSRVDQWLFDRLNRPLRVCGIVRNEGEPGGGPFFVRGSDGSITPQVVEDAQINHDDPRQKEIFESSTHFNPTDLVCGLRDYKGRPFDLEPFRDADTGFISRKSHQGRELLALELPGLWNGSMAFWNTVFVETPTETFTPVKTVNDLLRDVHQSE